MYFDAHISKLRITSTRQHETELERARIASMGKYKYWSQLKAIREVKIKTNWDAKMVIYRYINSHFVTINMYLHIKEKSFLCYIELMQYSPF